MHNLRSHQENRDGVVLPGKISIIKHLNRWMEQLHEIKV